MYSRWNQRKETSEALSIQMIHYSVSESIKDVKSFGLSQENAQVWNT